jgi:hypothetical protein
MSTTCTPLYLQVWTPQAANVGDLLGHDVLELELADEVNVVGIAGGQVPAGVAVLMGIARTVGGMESAVGLRLRMSKRYPRHRHR